MQENHAKFVVLFSCSMLRSSLFPNGLLYNAQSSKGSQRVLLQLSTLVPWSPQESVPQDPPQTYFPPPAQEPHFGQDFQAFLTGLSSDES
jgi:hypothetical protein